MMFAVASVDAGVPLWVFILLSVLGIVGAGGFAAFIRSLKNQAIRDSKLDELIDPEKGVMARLTAQDKAIADLQRSVEEVTKLRTDFTKHLEASERHRRSLRREIARKQDRIAA